MASHSNPSRKLAFPPDPSRAWTQAWSASRSPWTPTSSPRGWCSRGSTFYPATICWRFWGRRGTPRMCRRTSRSASRVGGAASRGWCRASWSAQGCPCKVAPPRMKRVLSPHTKHYPRSPPLPGIKRLDMLPPGQDGRKVHESVGITSPDGEAGRTSCQKLRVAQMCLPADVTSRFDAHYQMPDGYNTHCLICFFAASPLHTSTGEYLPLVAPVVTEGRPEEWLGRVEAAMFAATKRALVRGLEDSKGERAAQELPASSLQSAVRVPELLPPCKHQWDLSACPRFPLPCQAPRRRSGCAPTPARWCSPPARSCGPQSASAPSWTRNRARGVRSRRCVGDG